MKQSKRKLSMSMKAVSGAISTFEATVAGKTVISAEGTEKPEWEGEIGDKEVKVRIEVIGIGNAEYHLKIDAPDGEHDVDKNFELEGGYHEYEDEV